MKKTPKLRFPEFSGEWQERKCSSIFDKVRNSVDVKENEKYKQIGIRSHGKGLFYKEEVTGKELGNKRVFWVEPNVFVVNIVFAWERAVARTTENDLGLIASHRFPMYKPKEGILDLDYITYFFKTNKGKSLLELASPGGAGRNKTLGQKEFDNLDIVLPKIEEQKKISGFLSVLDIKLNKQQEKVEALEEYKKGIMQKIFSQEMRFKDENGKDYSDWKEVKLDSICSIRTGKLDANAASNDGKYRFYTCAKEYFYINSYAFDTEALLVSGNGANVGCIHYYNGKFNAYQRTYVLDGFNEEILYIKFYLEKYLKDRILQEKNEGNTPYIVLSTLSEMIIKIPIRSEQVKIKNLMITIDNKFKKENKKLEQLEQLKQGLLQQMFI